MYLDNDPERSRTWMVIRRGRDIGPKRPRVWLTIRRDRRLGMMIRRVQGFGLDERSDEVTDLVNGFGWMWIWQRIWNGFEIGYQLRTIADFINRFPDIHGQLTAIWFGNGSDSGLVLRLSMDYGLGLVVIQNTSSYHMACFGGQMLYSLLARQYTNGFGQTDFVITKVESPEIWLSGSKNGYKQGYGRWSSGFIRKTPWNLHLPWERDRIRWIWIWIARIGSATQRWSLNNSRTMRQLGKRFWKHKVEE